MNTPSVGVDIVEIWRVKRVLEKHPQRFLERVYTPVEVAFCRGRVPELAARFSAKEAVMKALGTGARGLAWQEIEVLPDPRGKPMVYLYGRAARRAKEIGADVLEISLTHAREYAAAVVVANYAGPTGKKMHSWREHLIGRLRERGLLE